MVSYDMAILRKVFKTIQVRKKLYTDTLNVLCSKTFRKPTICRNIKGGQIFFPGDEE